LALEDDRKAEVLPQYLIGSAQAIYETLSQDQRRPYSEVRKVLIQRLAPLNITDTAMKQLRKRKQKHGEPIHTYAGAISRLVNDALPQDIDDGAKNKIKTTVFLEGLRLKNKQMVKFPRPKDFEEAVTRARQHENLDSSSDDSLSDDEKHVRKHKSNRKRRSPSPRVVAAVTREHTAEQPDNNTVNKFSQQIQQLTNRIENLDRNQFNSFQRRGASCMQPAPTSLLVTEPEIKLMIVLDQWILGDGLKMDVQFAPVVVSWSCFCYVSTRK